jgi:error-prone DNA polymerase
MRATKGSYTLTPQDISQPSHGYEHLRGMPDCLSILVPEFPAKEETLGPQLEWMVNTFPARAWVGLTLHQRAMDDIHRGLVEHVADKYRVSTCWPERRQSVLPAHQRLLRAVRNHPDVK